MNISNAIVFMALGGGMTALPWLAPGWFPHSTVDAASARMLWTLFMGSTQWLIGAGTFAWLVAQKLIVQTRRATIPKRALTRGAVATADWEPGSEPEALLAVDLRGVTAAR